MTITPIQNDPALAEVLASGDADDWIGVIGHLATEDRLPSATRIITRFGNIVTLKLRRGDLPALQESQACNVIEASRRITIPSDSSAGHLEESVDTIAMRPASLRETGAGVVVGVVDWGIDFAHPAFIRDGQTRLAAIWDQRAHASHEESSNRWGYGRILTREQINAALGQSDPYEALDYLPWDADPSGRGAHGTHVASIAAGSAYRGGNAGVAPGSDIVFVHLANTPNILANQSLGSAQTALEAMDFIFETAGGRPAVINLSVGAHGGSHTGRSLVERGMDQAVWMRPGRAIVNSAGNYRQKGAHASGRLKIDESRVLDFQLPPNDRNNSEVEVFYAAGDQMTVTLVAPDGTTFGPVAIDAALALEVGGEKIGHLYQRLDPSSGDRHVDAFLYTNAPHGKWQLQMHATQVEDGRFHAWIERDASQQPFFVGDDVDTQTTIGTLANGEFSITTGAYDRRNPQRPIGTFSSLGPTRLGRIKPEVVAPGVRIRAARSTPRGAQAAPRSTVKTGTSMAAPMVAGAVALMFEAATQPMEIADTRALVIASLDRNTSCTSRGCFQEDLHGRGYGALNIPNLIRHTREWKTNRKEATINPENLANAAIESSEHDHNGLRDGTLGRSRTHLTPIETLIPSLPAWQGLIGFRPPLSIQRSLRRRFIPDAYVHRIERARGDINVDYYPVRVTHLPSVGGRRLSAEQMLRHIRLNINRFIDTDISRFSPYSASDARRWRARSPLASVMHIDMKTAAGYINPDDGSVVCSRVRPNHWVFSTIWTPADLSHPVSGNREFGFKTNGDEWVFYTRGADRTTGRLDALMSRMVFSAADRLWLSFQRGITDFVNTHGGVAVATRRISARHNWFGVSAAYHRPSTRWL